MKITLINTINRDIPDTFPPYGSLSIINYLRKNGFEDVEFINVDYHRYSIDQIIDLLCKSGTDILGISAVTSTSYNFTLEISLKFKQKRPESLIVLGGNMAASAEIILNKTGVDICVLGEGEIVFLNLVKRAHETMDLADYNDIPGLMYKSESIINTGYEKQLSNTEIYDVDWNDLESSREHYMFDVLDTSGHTSYSGTYHPFHHDSRTYESHRKNKKFVDFIVGKGCVNRCTFCHRWDKGIRFTPVDILMDRLDFLIENYNIGFIYPFVESFAVDKKWMPDFLEEIKKRDILWFMGAVRAKTISPELIEKCKDSGCVTIGYGHETGSEKMLNIMEKKTTQEDNVNAQKWAINAGFYSSVIQLVIGMPGEDISTIKETANFTQYSYTLSKHLNPFSISINYAQALPGTDFYEYGRRMGLIGKNIDDEEQYLIEVSDHNAGSSDTLNFTNYPMNVYLSWKYYILFGTVSAYVKKFGFRHLIMKINNKGPIDTNHDYKNISFLKDLLNYKNSFRVIIYLLLFKINFILPTLSLLKLYKNKPKKIIKHTADYFKYLMGNYKESNKLNLNKSLRKVIKNNELPYIETDIPEMIPLRKGR